jgi:hypothetical protein
VAARFSSALCLSAAVIAFSSWAAYSVTRSILVARHSACFVESPLLFTLASGSFKFVSFPSTPSFEHRSDLRAHRGKCDDSNVRSRTQKTGNRTDP